LKIDSASAQRLTAAYPFFTEVAIPAKVYRGVASW